MNPVALDDGRPVWNSAKALVLTVAGGASGFSSFYRLPVMFVTFGVGNFMIPYIVCLLLIAFPLSALELFLGYQMRKASAGTFAELHPRAVGVGYAMPLIGAVVVAIYSSVVVGWTVFPFFIRSFAQEAPFNFESVQEAREFWHDRALFTGDNFVVLLVLAAVWFIASLIAGRGIRSIMIAVYFTVPIPHLFLLGLMAYACTVADRDRLARILSPTVDGVFDFAVWGNAVGQSLLSVQAANGNLVAFGSFCRPVHNTFNISVGVFVHGLVLTIIFATTTACAMSLLDWESAAGDAFFIGFFAPLGIFASLISKVTTSGPLAICFFACVLVLALEHLATALQVLYSILWDFAVALRGRKLGFLIGVGSLALSVPLTLRGSYDAISALDQATVAVALPLIAAAETIVVGYCWADKSIVTVMQERSTPGGWAGFKAFVSIAFHQSVGRIVDLARQQGRPTRFASALPLFVKLLIPVACLVSCIGSFVMLCRNVEAVGLPGFFCGVGIVLVTLCVIIANAAFAVSKTVAVPWTDEVTMSAVGDVGSSSPEHAQTAPSRSDTVELRPT
uniref:Uncharacterized protein n=1 Tax=Neobodo designis TaxID=312471 RepID=A0A7S1R6Z6_NEODS|mmetsp:Transcript_91/g.320  ORF Transcript_91/g.320 Transcript_91/m.320 type:complete len:563 (+) Transcript_91:35-1723(+)